MLSMIDKYDLKIIRNKFSAIYLLNLTDVISTLFLIHTGYFIEANIFMQKIISDDILTLLIKILIPLLLLSLIYIRIKKATEKQLHGQINLLIHASFSTLLLILHMSYGYQCM